MKKRFLSFLAIAIMIATTIQSQVPTKGLVAYYPFNGNANDSSGKGNNGSVNGVTLTSDRFGNKNSAYSFDGISNNIYIQHPILSNNPCDSNWTISFWFLLPKISDSMNSFVVFSNGRTQGQSGFNGFGWFDSSVKRIYGYWYGRAGLYATDSNYKANTWYNLTYVYTSINSTLKVYVNGVDKSGKIGNTNTGGLASNLGNWYVGSSGYYSAYFKGKIDDIRLYSRSLDSSEIQALYHESNYDIKTPSLPTNGLVAYYPFSGNANDSSGNGNNGTVSGAKLTTDRFGKANKAYSFDGVSNQIIVPNSPTLTFNNSISFSFWGKLDSLVSGIPLAIRDENTAHETSTRTDMGATPFPDYDINNGISGGNVYVKSQIKTDLNWHNFIGVFNQSTNVTTFYIDGKLQGTSNVAITTIDKAHLTFGAASYSWGSNQYFKGKIDDIRIYNRSIDSIEIQNLYHEGGYPINNLTIPSNGLVAWYPFTGNANDSSGHNFNGVNNGATLTTDRFGNANSAYNFGKPSFIDLTMNNYGISGSADRTISAWVNTPSTNTYGQRVISMGMYKSGTAAWDSSYNGKFFQMTLDNNHLNLTGGDCGGVYGCLSCSIVPKSGPNVTNSLWHHLVIVYKSKVGYLYVDGALTNQLSMPFMNTTGNANYIGISNDGLQDFLIGKADDIAIYNRGLDSSEILNLYHQGGYLLPVTIETFFANSISNEVSINWKTSSEINTSKFIIQHSSDGISFTDIGNINATGNGANIYDFTDNNPVNGINYYRLKSVENDGRSSYSKVVSVTFGDKESFSIVPNPAKDFATISFSKSFDKASIAVYDMAGKQVIKQSLNASTSTYKLNTQSLKSGLYVIKVNTDKGIYNEKLLINK